MRQLGARLPEPPRVNTHEEARQFDDARMETDHLDTAQERSVGLASVPRQEGTPWGLLEPEKEHRFPFLTLAVPSIAAVLALGALLWSGSLRDRVRQQDAAMYALQAQNQKLADTLEEMSVEQKAASALRSGSVSQPPSVPAAVSPVRQEPPPAKSPQPAKQPEIPQRQQVQPSEQRPETSPAKPQTPPVSAQPTSQSAGQQPSGQEKQTASAAQRQDKPVDAGHSPELVPPYPTNYHPLTATSVAPANPPAQPANTYRAPFSVAGSGHTEPPANAAGTTTARTTLSAPVAPPLVSHRPASPDQYNAAGNGLYASSLAENIEAVQGLQRHSTVPLQEFHVHEGMLTKITPALGLSVRRPDPGHGTYSLIVDGGSQSYQLRGQVNNPLVFTDNATHREYELVVLRIADRQVYGYVRAMR